MSPSSFRSILALCSVASLCGATQRIKLVLHGRQAHMSEAGDPDSGDAGDDSERDETRILHVHQVGGGEAPPTIRPCLPPKSTQ